ncbi:MAG: glucokinase [Roseobacter sp.]|jgi:glucokinase|nr:glucokinase [Roseobacter sp.]
MQQTRPPCFLVADIGGTNTRVAISDGAHLRKASIKRYRNADFDSFAAVLQAYLSDRDLPVPDAACVALAGPVRAGKGRLTNRDWSVDEAQITRETGAAEVALLNDLQAQGYALGHVDAADVLHLRAGRHAPENASKLVVNLGTGFNASPVFETPSGPFVTTSESGHANMPVRDGRDLALCQFVEAQHGFAAIDDVLSGRGLERVYAFVAQESGSTKTADSATIMANCADQSDPVAVEAVSYFIRLTAMVMGNLALVQLPFGGIYLVGGLSSAIVPYMAQAGFEAAFRDKGRFGDFMDDFGVYVVQDDYAALKGMAAFLNNRMG